MSPALAPRRLTIRRQLTIRLLLAFGVPLVVAGLGGFGIIRANLLARLDASLLARAEAIAGATTWDAGVLRVDTSSRFMREFDAADARVERDEGVDASPARTATASALRSAPSVYEVRAQPRSAAELMSSLSRRRSERRRRVCRPARGRCSGT